MGAEHARLFRVIHRLTGVTLGDEKVYLLRSRLGDMMRQYSLDTFDQVADKLEDGIDREFIDQLVDRITTHETRFFRDENVFDALSKQIIPEWMERENISIATMYGSKMSVLATDDGVDLISGIGLNGIDRELNIWSAGCSTGQEPYSIAMMIESVHPAVMPITKIVATDIASATVQRAQEGVYTSFEVGRGLSEDFKTRYFSEVGVNRFRIVDRMKRCIEFRKHNLVTDRIPGKFDIVFCRNVSIYFTEEQKKKLFEKLRDSLKPNGVLVLGTAETLAGYVGQCIVREFGVARYYQIVGSGFSHFKI